MFATPLATAAAEKLAKTRTGSLADWSDDGRSFFFPRLSTPTLVRITGGDARGIVLQVPKGDLVRPATDGMRQAVFSSLGARVAEAWFLDLFAGSGAYGLEALSRGAAGGYFVEKNIRPVDCIRKNITAVCKSLRRSEEEISVRQCDVLDWSLPPNGRVPGIVFVDPPYDAIERVASPLFERLTQILAPQEEPVIVFEMPGEIDLVPAGWKSVRRLGKGARQPTVAFFRRAAAL